MRLGFVIIYVEDVKETMRFYQEAFGLEVKLEYEEQGNVDYGEMKTEGATLGFASHELGQMNLAGKYQKSSLDEAPFGQEIAFVTENVGDSYERALKAGAVPISEPAEKPWGQTVAYLRTKEGTLIELCTPMNG